MRVLDLPGTARIPAPSLYSHLLDAIDDRLEDAALPIAGPGRRVQTVERTAGDLHAILGRIGYLATLIYGDTLERRPVHARMATVAEAGKTLAGRYRAALGYISAARDHAGTRKVADNELRKAHVALCEAQAALKRLHREVGL